MKSENCKFALVRVATLAFLLSATAASACSYSSSPRPVKNSFSVEVTYKGRPVRDLGVALSTVVDADSDVKPVLVKVGRTDARGIIQFSNVTNGDYDVEVAQPALPYSIWIRVGRAVDKMKPAEVLDFEWPGEAIAVREVSGSIKAPRNTGNRLMDLARPQFQVVPNAKVVLSNLISNKPILSTVTDESGNFALNATQPGMYVLHVERPADNSFRSIVSDTPLVVDPAAPTLVLDIHLKELCGSMVAYNGYPH